jgi:hypothetical protein
MTDEEDFDETEAQLKEIRSISGGAEILAGIERGAKSFAQEAWAIAKPAGLVLGATALEAAKSFALSALETELTKLAGGG